MNPSLGRQLRTLSILGRAGHLPTVWSNTLAGWWLGGGGNHWKLPFLFSGMSVLYLGGAFLNDAFDAESDQRRHPERPVPAGKISRTLVWQLGFGQLVLGIFLLLFCGQVAAGAAILLALCILLYNFSHQFFTAAPWLMGACRFWTYVIAGATGAAGLNGWPILCGAALAFYVAGAGSVPEKRIFGAAAPFWPLGLLASPVILAMVMNTGGYRVRAIWISAGVVLWSARCVRPIFGAGTINAGRVLSGLLAGMVLVDWLAVVPQCPTWLGAMFLALFGLTLFLHTTLLTPSGCGSRARD